MNDFAFNAKPIGYGMDYGPSVANAGGVLQPNGTTMFDPSGGYGSLPNYGGGGGFDLSANYAGRAPALPPGSLTDSFFTQTRTDGSTSGGYGAAALSTFTGLTNAWLGMKQYGLAKDALKEGTRQFNMNYDAQKKTTNEHLESRQKARIGAAGPGSGLDSVETTMQKYGIK